MLQHHVLPPRAAVIILTKAHVRIRLRAASETSNAVSNRDQLQILGDIFTFLRRKFLGFPTVRRQNMPFASGTRPLSDAIKFGVGNTWRDPADLRILLSLIGQV
eukprot:6177417-Pleurochrysis_carterae.AAC.2